MSNGVSKLLQKDLTIQDLNKSELKHVFEVFAKEIGVSNTLEKYSTSKDAFTLDEFIDAFRNVELPDKYASAIEMAWTSGPINGYEFKRLKGYSVFWKMEEQGWQIWIGRTPSSPQNKEAIMYTADIINELYRNYGLYISEDARDEHSIRLLKWRIKRKIIYASIYAAWIIFMLYTISRTEYNTNTDIYNSISIGLIAFFLSKYVADKFGTILAAVLCIIATTFYLFIIQRVYSLDVINEQWMIFGVSLVIGLYFSDKRYPDTIGDYMNMTLKRIFARLYRMHTVTAIVCIFAYGAINAVIVNTQHLDITSILLLIILSAITLLAIVGIGRKESGDKD